MSAGIVNYRWCARKRLTAAIDCTVEAILVLLNVERAKARMDRSDVSIY